MPYPSATLYPSEVTWPGDVITDADFTVICLPGNKIRTHPPVVLQDAAENIRWGFDVTRVVGTAVGTVTSTLTDHLTKLPVTLADAPQWAPGDIIQRIEAGVLTVKHSYRLRIDYRTGISVFSATLTINCPEG